ncbi:hypothetical protein [Sulfurimonas sp.]|uniref:hypothetical protein n=1 Tax=Sulfurimonas sp. TaxID=2022749 RepID=UPI003565FDE8
MKKIFLYAMLIVSLSEASSFEIKENNKMFDLSMFNTDSNKRVVHTDREVKCRMVCDRKINKEELLKSAISFYKNSKDYHFEINSYK